tara:strand:- start:6440 stop:6574 length:135 start_codon:yes stop_codon:yes gene_type:complete
MENLSEKQLLVILDSLQNTQARYTVGDRFWQDYQEIIDFLKKKN